MNKLPQICVWHTQGDTYRDALRERLPDTPIEAINAATHETGEAMLGAPDSGPVASHATSLITDAISSAEILLAWKVPPRTLTSMPALRWVQVTGAGVATSAPVITCRQSPLIVFCDLADLAAGGARVEFPLPTVSDECDEDISVTCDPPSGSLFPMGTTTVVCVASDSEGNTSNCTFSVEVVDETAPVLACPDDIVVECASVDGEIVDYPAPLITNECNGEPTLECDPPAGSLFPLGTTTVVCRATDAAGNSGVCTFDVTLRADTVAPELTCPPDLVVSSTCGPGGLGLPDTGGARVEFPLPAVTDNCAGEIEVFCDPPSGSFFPMGVTATRASLSSEQRRGNSVGFFNVSE